MDDKFNPEGGFMQEAIEIDVLDMVRGITSVPINGRFVYPIYTSSSIPIKLCQRCGKPDHGTAACDVKF